MYSSRNDTEMKRNYLIECVCVDWIKAAHDTVQRRTFAKGANETLC
jgi:hypothetical protein